MHPNRIDVLKTVSAREPLVVENPVLKVSDSFGEMSFGLREMEKHLNASDIKSLKLVAEGKNSLDPELAGRAADAVKEWAVSHGVTHFTHWFQPLTGSTAEKHDSFITIDKSGKLIEKFSVGQLIQSEPDASSFPSGGTRTTFEARGYTAWDVSSPIFIVKNGGTKILCIPSVFVSYKGHALDTKTGLLRSMDSIGNSAKRLLEELGEASNKVSTTIGCEQEYFLIDRSFLSLRPDLIMTGRTLVGADMPKGQELEDHYFGSIPPRVQAYMTDVESELYRLGIPCKTRHNEVAPGQFEMAPLFEDANIAADHNMLTMEILQKTARKHGLVCLLHEKPFEGVNGSGKHNNWSMATDSGENLLEPGETPQKNFRFLAFLSCVLRGVHKHQVALRASIANHGNDHRLGANEAPPAIVSVFLGETLTEILDKIEAGKDLSSVSAEEALIDFGINKLPRLPKHNTDRNRTSPFAFTGNKFEFRAVGSSQAISYPAAIINAAVGEAIDQFTKRFIDEKKNAKSTESALLKVIKEFVTESSPIRFEGNGYSDGWKKLAADRGLYELKNTPEALRELLKAEHHSFLIERGVYTQKEFDAIVEVQLERYVKHLNIEAQTLSTITLQHVLPAAQRYQHEVAEGVKSLEAVGIGSTRLEKQKNLLDDVSMTIESVYKKLDELEAHVKTLEDSETMPAAELCGGELTETMSSLRTCADRLERVVPDDLWPLPKYREMLFLR